MSDVVNVGGPGKHAKVEADPRKPYKAVAASVAAAIATLLGFGFDLPQWLIVVLTVVGAGAAAYVKKNPLRMKTVTGGRRP